MKRFFQNKQVVNKRGFTLVEVIVAFSVLVVVILASTDLLVTVIRSNTENTNTLIAYGLSQEGLEAFRNMRDSDWLLGAGFDGKVGNDCVWDIQGGSCLPAVSDGKKDFLIDFYQVDNPGQPDPNVTVDVSQIRDQYAPWKLQDVTQDLKNKPLNDFLSEAQLCLVHSQTNPDEVWYHPCVFAQTGTSEKMIFSRFVEVQALPYGTTDLTTAKKYRVSSVVDWQEQGRPKEVRLTSEITDWKGGPL